MPQAGAALRSSPTAFAVTAAMGIRAFPAKGFAMMLLSSDMNRGLKLMERQVSVSSSAASAPGPFTSAIGSVLIFSQKDSGSRDLLFSGTGMLSGRRGRKRCMKGQANADRLNHKGG